MNGLERFCYKWLPVFFGCHCRPDRSFFYHGKQFPICARCTGILAGMIVFTTTCWLFKPPVAAAVLMVLPLIIDGAVQKKTTYESTNIRRLLTGLLFGYAICWLIILFLMSGFHLGMRIGNALKK